MNYLKNEENECIKSRYGKCDSTIKTKDFLYCYPSKIMTCKKTEKIINLIQIQWNAIKEIIGFEPIKINKLRVVIGYRHKDDEGGKECHPGYGRHNNVPFINIPWPYLEHNNQPLECLSHEIIHVFTDIKKLKEPCDLWTEGMCDFVRLYALRIIGFDKIAMNMENQYRKAAWNSNNSYHDYAGRMLIWCDRNCINIKNVKELSKAISNLWGKDLSKELHDKI